MPICPIIGDGNFNHLVEVVPARFLHCKSVSHFIEIYQMKNLP